MNYIGADFVTEKRGFQSLLHSWEELIQQINPPVEV